MNFMKNWSIFNLLITIFNIVYFYDFFTNLTPIKPELFILICLFVIIFLLRKSPLLSKLGEFFSFRFHNFEKEKRSINYPLFSYIDAHYENGNLYAAFLLNLLHFGINLIFIYAFLKNNNLISCI